MRLLLWSCVLSPACLADALPPALQTPLQSRAVPMAVPMVLLSIPAKLVADWLFQGIYEWQIADAGYPFVTAGDVMDSRERAALNRLQVWRIGLGCDGSAGSAPATGGMHAVACCTLSCSWQTR